MNAKKYVWFYNGVWGPSFMMHIKPQKLIYHYNTSVSAGPGPGPGLLQSNIASVQSPNILRTRLSPCVAFALLFSFLSYKPHFSPWIGLV